MKDKRMWVKFLSDYDHHPRLNVILSYRAGEAYSVTHRCGENAIKAGKAGKAVKIETPNKGEVMKGQVKNGENGERGDTARVGQAGAAVKENTATG